MIVISICLSDIPAEARKKSDKNGKIYASFCVDEKKEPDQYGNTHAVWIQQNKEERQAKADKKYVGNGKEYKFGSTQSNHPNQPAPHSGIDNFPAQTSDDDDLPF